MQRSRSRKLIFIGWRRRDIFVRLREKETVNGHAHSNRRISRELLLDQIDKAIRIGSLTEQRRTYRDNIWRYELPKASLRRVGYLLNVCALRVECGYK